MSATPANRGIGFFFLFCIIIAAILFFIDGALVYAIMVFSLGLVVFVVKWIWDSSEFASRKF